MAKTILILGGYGNAGRPIADLLLKETTDSRIIIAGRNINRAQEVVDKLNQTYDGNRADARQVDASSVESLKGALNDIDLIAVASSTTRYAYQVIEAAVHANIDYFDVQVSDSYKTEALEYFKSPIERSQRCFVFDGGSHPGLPAALVRFAALQCAQLQKANLFCVMQPSWKDLSYSQETSEEFFREIGEMKNDVYTDGQWKKQSWSTTREYDFGETFKKRTCVPLFLDEMRDLPTLIPSLEDVGMYMAGLNPVVDYCCLPLGIAATSVCPSLAAKPMSRLFTWSLKSFSSPPYGAMISLEAEGAANEEEGPTQAVHSRISIFHEDGYLLTAIPAVACLLQILDGSACKPGVHYQSHIVEPKRFFSDMERMGLEINIESM